MARVCVYLYIYIYSLSSVTYNYIYINVKESCSRSAAEWRQVSRVYIVYYYRDYHIPSPFAVLSLSLPIAS